MRAPREVLLAAALAIQAGVPALAQDDGDAPASIAERIDQSLGLAEDAPRRLRSPIDTDTVNRRIDQGMSATGQDLVKADPAYGAYQRGHFLTAFALALDKAETGDATSQTLLGELLARGLGVKQDYGEAAEWYRLAAEQGDSEAAYALARLYLDGLGVAKDPAKAADLFEKAAQAGQAVAWRELAYLVLKGEGRAKNAMLAAADLRRAAIAGDADAQYALAGLFAEGVGVVANEAEAARWYRQAAMQSHYGAQVELAILLFNGRGVAKDENQAALWLKEAATHGNAPAQLRYSRLLAEGRGVPANTEEAAKWYFVARAKGFRDDFMEDWILKLDAATAKEARAAASRWLGAAEPVEPARPPAENAASAVDNRAE